MRQVRFLALMALLTGVCLCHPAAAKADTWTADAITMTINADEQEGNGLIANVGETPTASKGVATGQGQSLSEQYTEFYFDVTVSRRFVKNEPGPDLTVSTVLSASASAVDGGQVMAIAWGYTGEITASASGSILDSDGPNDITFSHTISDTYTEVAGLVINGSTSEVGSAGGSATASIFGTP